MADPWGQLGAALGGDSELQYQQGLALGAKTQDALAAAKARVMENEAKQNIQKQLEAAGISPERAGLTATTFQGGGNLGDAMKTLLSNQEIDFRAKAGDPNVPLDVGQRSLLGVSNAPVEPLYKVGGGYGNKFDSEAGITPLGDALGGEGGGSAAGMQYARTLGLIDANGHIVPGKEALFYDVIHPTGRSVSEGGVPGKVDFNPYRTDVAPTAPGAAPAPAGAPGAGITPVSDAARVGANAGEIERAKTVGTGTGKAQLELPQALARFTNQTAQADLVVDNIDKAINEASVWTAGPIGKAIGFLPGTPAYDFQARINTIKANTGFQQLQQMRYESPTGGALGQVAVQELEFLQSALGSLDTAQSPQALSEALGQVSQRYKQFKAAAAADFHAAQQKASGVLPNGAPAPTAAPATAPQETKVIGGKTYVKVNGQWFEDDGT